LSSPLSGVAWLRLATR